MSKLKKPKTSQTQSDSSVKPAVAQVTAYQGPIPPPKILAEYEAVQPGLADRIMKLAENESQHRHKINEEWLKSTFRQQAIGQFCGLTIGAAALVAASVCAIYGHPITGAIIGGTGIGGLISAFLYRRSIKE